MWDNIPGKLQMGIKMYSYNSAIFIYLTPLIIICCRHIEIAMSKSQKVYSAVPNISLANEQEKINGQK